MRAHTRTLGPLLTEPNEQQSKDSERPSKLFYSPDYNSNRYLRRNICLPDCRCEAVFGIETLQILIENVDFARKVI